MRWDEPRFGSVGRRPPRLGVDGVRLPLHHPDGRTATCRAVDATDRDGGIVQFAAASRVSISSRSSEKSIGLVNSPEAPFSIALRLVSGRWADRSHRYWLITGLGYLVQMTVIPLLALAAN